MWLTRINITAIYKKKEDRSIVFKHMFKHKYEMIKLSMYFPKKSADRLIKYNL